jgi:hypothetical protein
MVSDTTPKSSQAESPLTEPISKNVGRPRDFADWEMELVKNYCDAKTLRGQQNWLYMLEAMGELGITSCEPHQYKCLPQGNDVSAGRAKLPCVLLSEIGRLNRSDMHHVAAEIDKRGLSQSDAIRFVKQVRTGGKKRKFSAFELTERISKTIDLFWESHEATLDQILFSLECVSETVSEMKNGGGE